MFTAACLMTLSIGQTFTVNHDTAGSQFAPACASSSKGTVVVAWTETHNAADHNIRARVFYPLSGLHVSPTGADLVIDNTLNDDTQPSVGVDGTGHFVVSWTRSSNAIQTVMARRFDEFGKPLGDVFPVNADASAESKQDSHAAMSNQGAFVVSYTKLLPKGQSKVHAVLYNHTGSPVGNFTQPGFDASAASHSKPAMDAAGIFNVAFENADDGLPAHVIYLVHSQGNNQGPGIGPLQTIDGDLNHVITMETPSVAIDAHSNSVVAYLSQGDIWARAVQWIDPATNSPKFLMSDVTNLTNSAGETDSMPAVAMSVSGKSFVVAYATAFPKAKVTKVRVIESTLATDPNSNKLTISLLPAVDIDQIHGSLAGAPALCIDSSNNYMLTYPSNERIFLQNSPNIAYDIAGVFGKLP